TVSFGDLNDDTIINVQDIVLIVGLVLNDGYSLPADLNSDGIVNVLDIVALVNLILG
ncbi:MAG: glycoside hydrolase, partial [Candidatus Marinimicrobia bacterium]|nr:glycoside hydrolase [Candidatus Neomarinimicrobiota bacterium]